MLKVAGIKKRYGYINALNDVSFELSRGDFLSVFGPNGAGKTTLLKILSCQTRATGGDIFYQDASYKSLRDNFREKFGVISHQSFLYNGLSAQDNLKFYGKLYGVSDLNDRIDYLLEKVNLLNRKDDLVGTYSRGMIQRVAIARALIHEPDIVFLDEPYTGLDRHAAGILTSMLEELLNKSKTIMLITHNLSLGFGLASKIAVLNRGNLEMFEDKKNLNKDDFEDRYIAIMEGE